MRIIPLMGLMLTLSLQAHEQLLNKEWTMMAAVKGESFERTLQKLGEMNVDIAGISYEEQQIDVLIDDHDYEELAGINFDVDVFGTKGVSRGPDEEYKNPQEITDILHSLHQQYPDLTELRSIGKSLEGRDIWAIKITDPTSGTDIEKPSILFNSMHHAREVMTPEVSIDIVEYLLSNFERDAKVTDWLQSTVVWVIPMFNVDGNNKMWNSDSFWRKNTRNGHGVDLNRNYPTGWDKCRGSSGDKNSQTYRGASPASEPETQAMMKFIADVRPVFDISYHSYSQLVLYPFGCQGERAQNRNLVEGIGKQLGKLLGYKAGTAWELLYNADGGDIDWMYDAYQVIPFVIELNARSHGGFHPDYARYRDVTVEKNRKGWQFLLDRVHQSGVRGQVFHQGSPAKDFTIKVSQKNFFGKMKTVQDYVGHQNGVFHLVLDPGTYQLEISIEGQVKKIATTIVKENLSRENIMVE